ncbi:hypothetical protein MKW94_000054 [Papaver nudicaule]|uniref:Uncharacterized protein n=1 Tax=Papaver nudicaule TaxID=74823 RepID=A0AA41S829_PAPNU|nr:hypothetical protein [Papaver nudicaule]
MSLETVDLSFCRSITDLGISFLIQNCSQLARLHINSCTNITDGIDAIVSGGGLEYVSLSVLPIKVGERCINTTEAVTQISKELEGWQAIGRNCKNLELLTVWGCKKLCNLGLQALGDGCDKLSMLWVYDANCCSSSALEVFERKKPGVMFFYKALVRW